MSKAKKTVTYKIDENPSQMMEEPAILFETLRTVSALKNLNYAEFKKLADKVPFTNAEWASILHVSERTLQRYAKNNGTFAPINAERFQQINVLIKRGKEVFGDVNKFYNWLKRAPYMLEGNVSIQSLTTYDGIQHVFTQLGRIEHGIFA